MVISVLDGSVIRDLLEDEDEFAMLAEVLFTKFDADGNGKLSRSELRPVILQLGVGMGVPTPSGMCVVSIFVTSTQGRGNQMLSLNDSSHPQSHRRLKTF